MFQSSQQATEDKFRSIAVHSELCFFFIKV